MKGRRFGWVGAWFAGLLCSAVALGAERVVSPDGRTAADFELKSGVPTVRVTYDGAAAFEATVGLVPERFDLLNVRRRTVDASWKPVWGFRSSYPERYGELSVELAQRKGVRPIARLTLRAYDEGFAVRSESGLEVYALGSVEREATEFRFPSGAAAWCIAGTEATSDANPTRLEALDAAKNWRMPFTLRIPGTAARHHLWLDIHDAHIPDGFERTYPNVMITEGGGGDAARLSRSDGGDARIARAGRGGRTLALRRFREGTAVRL